MWKTWPPTHGSCCKLAQSSASWTRWSAIWRRWVSCRWPHDHDPARRKTSWHLGENRARTHTHKLFMEQSCIVMLWSLAPTVTYVQSHKSHLFDFFIRACRLKKKAQYEANKVKLWGLSTEYGKLLMTSYRVCYTPRSSILRSKASEYKFTLLYCISLIMFTFCLKVPYHAKLTSLVFSNNMCLLACQWTRN